MNQKVYVNDDVNPGGYLAMDEQRMQTYVGLIEQLLGCPQEQEAELLQANAELLDADLLRVSAS